MAEHVWEPVIVNGQPVHTGGDGPPSLPPFGSWTTWPSGPWPKESATWALRWTPSPVSRRLRQLADRHRCLCGHQRGRHRTRCRHCACRYYRRAPRPPNSPHRRWDVWTPEELRAVLDARAAGVTYKALGQRFGGLSAYQMRNVWFRAERQRAAGKLPPPEWVRRRRQLRAVPARDARPDLLHALPMAHPHEAPDTHLDAPTQHHTVEEAALLLLAGLNVMRPRLAHGYGCPAEHAGPCTCGYLDVVSGTEELVGALQAAQVPPEGAKRH